jgi:hypothetical protein
MALIDSLATGHAPASKATGLCGPGGGMWTGQRLSSGYRQVAWQSAVLRLSPFRPRLFGDGVRFHGRQR